MLHLTALLIERTVPGVRKTVKWNSAFYGVKGGDWFLGMHCFTNSTFHHPYAFLELGRPHRRAARPRGWTQMTTWSKSCAMPGHAGTAPLAKEDTEGHT
jgi:hypothetical protein